MWFWFLLERLRNIKAKGLCMYSLKSWFWSTSCHNWHQWYGKYRLQILIQIQIQLYIDIDTDRVGRKSVGQYSPIHLLLSDRLNRFGIANYWQHDVVSSIMQKYQINDAYGWMDLTKRNKWSNLKWICIGWSIYNASVSVGLTGGVCKGISEAITVIEQEMSWSWNIYL